MKKVLAGAVIAAYSVFLLLAFAMIPTTDQKIVYLVEPRVGVWILDVALCAVFLVFGIYLVVDGFRAKQ